MDTKGSGHLIFMRSTIVGNWCLKPYSCSQRKLKKDSSIMKMSRLLYGAWEKNRQDIIPLDCDGSSVYRKARVRETIEIMNVVELFTKYNIENIKLMKVNIEGGEYELLPRLIESGFIKRIRNIQIQFHEIDPESEISMEKICRDLTTPHSLFYQ